MLGTPRRVSSRILKARSEVVASGGRATLYFGDGEGIARTGDDTMTENGPTGERRGASWLW